MIVYLVLINVITFAAFFIDKRNAIRHRRRIRVSTLLWLSFIGGSVGGLSAMYLFRHKTRKACFTVGIPLMMVMQAIVIFYLINVMQ